MTVAPCPRARATPRHESTKGARVRGSVTKKSRAWFPGLCLSFEPRQRGLFARGVGPEITGRCCCWSPAAVVEAEELEAGRGARAPSSTPRSSRPRSSTCRRRCRGTRRRCPGRHRPLSHLPVPQSASSQQNFTQTPSQVRRPRRSRRPSRRARRASCRSAPGSTGNQRRRSRRPRRRRCCTARW